MKSGPHKSLLSRLLMGLGLVLMVFAVLLFLGGTLARQVEAEAERLALAHVLETSAAVAELQTRLADPVVERAALSLVGTDRINEEELIEALGGVGLNSVLTAQVFQPDLEELLLGEYPNPDFTTLEMLLEARRSGTAVPESRVFGGQPVHLALAQRLPSEDETPLGFLLVRLPIERLTESIAWADELDFVALAQGLGERRTEIWRRGVRPVHDPARVAVPGTRFWLEWHRSTLFPAAGLQEVSISALIGVIVFLFGVRLRSPGRALTSPFRLPGAARRGVTRTAGAPVGAMRQAAQSPPAREGKEALVPGVDTRGETSARITPAETHSEQSARASVSQAGGSVLESDAAGVDPSPSAELTPSDPELADAGAPADDLSPASLKPEPAEESSGRDSDGPVTASDDIDPSRSETEPGSKQKPRPEPFSAGKSTPPWSPPPVEPRLFTDAGILGRFDAGLDARSATLIGQAIAALAAERGVGQIAVARDGRLHGPVLIAALTQGLRSGGLDVLDFGAIPSPLLDYAALELPGQSAVMVSAAHLPSDWNGLRVMIQGQLLVGRSVHDLLEGTREARLASRQGLLESASATADYVESVVARIQIKRPLKVVVDCANTVTGLLIPRLLDEIGVNVIPLYADVDGAFPNHLPDPSRLDHLEDLRLCVRNFRADLGLAFGGDGDRVVMVAPDGAIIWPDRMLMLLARDLLIRRPQSTIVQDAMCSPRVLRHISSLGGRVETCGLGPVSLAATLERSGGVLGASFAGQFCMPGEWSRSADALFAACKLLEVLASDPHDIPELLGELPSWISLPPVFLPTLPTPPDQVLDQLLESADVSDAEVGSDHGFSIDFGHAWTRICRSADGSGLLVRFEGDDEIAVERLRALVRQLLLVVDERLRIPF